MGQEVPLAFSNIPLIFLTCSQTLARWEEWGERSEVAEIPHLTNTTFDCNRLFNFILPWDHSRVFGDMHLFLSWPGDISPDLPSIKVYLFLFQLVFHTFLSSYDFVSAMIFFSSFKEGKALYSQQKQDMELPVAQIMTPYCQIQT